MKFAAALLKQMRAAELAACFVAFSAMAIILMVDVAMREILGAGWFGASQRAVFAMVIVVFFALGLATADGVHLRPRFADGLIPKRWEPLLLRVADVITASFYLFVAVLAFYVVRDTYELDEHTSTLRWVVWPFQFVMVVAFGMSGLRHIIYLIFPPLRPSDSVTQQAATAIDDESVGPDAQGGGKSES